MAAGAPSIEGKSVEIAGLTVRTYQLPEGVTLYFTTTGKKVLVASTESAMTRSIHTQRGGKSIRDDAAFTKSMSRISPYSTKAVFVHPRRSLQMAKRFMSPGEWREVEPMLGPLTDTVVSLVIDHSGERFRISAEVTGVPDIGDLVAELIGAEMLDAQRHVDLNKAIQSHEWDQALAIIDEVMPVMPDDRDLVRKKFDILAAGKKDRAAALAVADELFKKYRDDAMALNNAAWALLTEKKYGGAYAKLALKLSERSNELTDHKNWAYVDTLALAKFETGDVDGAIALEEMAIELAGDRASDDLQKALTRFKAAKN
jgi:hypothetical protein